MTNLFHFYFNFCCLMNSLFLFVACSWASRSIAPPCCNSFCRPISSRIRFLLNSPLPLPSAVIHLGSTACDSGLYSIPFSLSLYYISIFSSKSSMPLAKSKKSMLIALISTELSIPNPSAIYLTIVICFQSSGLYDFIFY